MPRSKPRHVDALRIELGTKERQQFDDALLAYQFNKIGTPLVALVSDISAMTAITSAYLVYRYGGDALELLEDSYDNTGALLKSALRVTKLLPPLQTGVDLFRIYQNLRNNPYDIPDFNQRSGEV
jgi:hypothetical protein